MNMNLVDMLLGKKNYSEITVAELGHLPEDARFIDVRQPDEFVGDLGHLDGAELVPLGTLPSVATAWDRDAPLLLVCRSGNRSGQGCDVLTRMGFKNVTNLKGGMLAVRAAGK